MKQIKINTFKLLENVIFEFKDLRDHNHPEFENYNDVEFHISQAIEQNGLRYYGNSVYDSVKDCKLNVKSISFVNHLYHLLGGAKGIIKFRIKHSISTFSRYKKHRYETIDILKKDILLKYKKRIYRGSNGYQRIELINSINDLCQNIDKPTVLEAGCGSGVNMYLLNSLNKNIEIHGFEYTNSRIASAIANLYYSPMINYLFLADVCDLKIPDNSFDIVFSNHVLEQLGQEKAEIALKEMWRVCKKGIVLSEPSIHGANLYEKWRMNTLGYCKDLYKVAKKLPNSRILVYKEDTIRTYPNTSHHLVVEKIDSNNATQHTL